MKRLFLTLLIFACGTVTAFVLTQQKQRVFLQLGEKREEWKKETYLLAEARSQHEQLRSEIKELKGKIASQSLSFSDRRNLSFLTGARNQDWSDLPSKFSESILAELGLNWSSSDDFLIVSKKTLEEISFSGLIQDGTFNKAMCAVLAMTPGDREKLNTTLQHVLHQRSEWAKAHAERIEPEGDIVAHHIIPRSPELYSNLSNIVMTAANDLLGPERGKLFLGYVQGDFSERGILMQRFYGQEQFPDVLIVRRHESGALNWELKRSMGGITTSTVSPWLFPEQFRSLFPNGWPDLAEREGFELPAAFPWPKK